jgi:hypothetical protein
MTENNEAAISEIVRDLESAGYNHDAAVYCAFAIEFASYSEEFKIQFGTRGIEYLNRVLAK